MIYNHSFHTVIGWYDDNETIVNHIWDNTMKDNSVIENVVDQAREQHIKSVQFFPQLHPDWLIDKEKSQRVNQAIHKEFLRRISAERAEGE